MRNLFLALVAVGTLSTASLLAKDCDCDDDKKTSVELPPPPTPDEN
jgi:hypothetical protein